jgi:cellulose synthase/poly-beta-1,6-N-acetylglucosamine synthase-like glycosyltransferase
MQIFTYNHTQKKINCTIAGGFMKLKKPTVSVILPTYNRAHLITRSVKSVLEQTFQDFEIIIVRRCFYR